MLGLPKVILLVVQGSHLTTQTDPHKGLTCSEAKDDMVGLLKKYMKENDVRICPNPACKMLM